MKKSSHSKAILRNDDKSICIHHHLCYCSKSQVQRHVAAHKSTRQQNALGPHESFTQDIPSIQQNTHVAALSTLHYAHQCTLGRGILAKVSWKRPSKEASNRQASVRTKLYKSIATWLTTLVTKRLPRNHVCLGHPAFPLCPIVTQFLGAS